MLGQVVPKTQVLELGRELGDVLSAGVDVFQDALVELRGATVLDGLRKAALQLVQEGGVCLRLKRILVDYVFLAVGDHKALILSEEDVRYEFERS